MEILRDTKFLRFYLADSFAKIADNFFFLFITWLALHHTGSPAFAGAILMTNAIPRLVFMIFGGSLADRIPPHVILRTGNIAQAIGLIVMLCMIILGAVSLPLLFIVAGLFGLVDAFSAPASMSAIPRIVPKHLLLKANSFIHGSEMILFISGSMLAGLVLQANNLAFATIFNFSLYIIAAILFLTVKIQFDFETEPAKTSELKRIIDGLKYAWGKPIVRANIILLGVTNIAISGPVTIGLLLLVTSSLGLTPLYYSIVTAAFGVGALIGVIIASQMKNIHSPGKIILASFLLDGIGLIIIALIGDIWLIVALTIIMGMTGGIAEASHATWVQASVKTSMLGRISALMMLASLAFDPISQGLTGLLSAWSIQGTLVVAGTFMIIATLVTLPFNKIFLRRLKTPIDTPV